MKNLLQRLPSKTNAFVLLAAASLAVLSTTPARAADKPHVLVYSVENVKLTFVPATGKVKVVANGRASTGGWTEPMLIASPGAPADGKTHLDFVAVKPSGIVPQIVLPISASTEVSGHAGLFCVVVRAKEGAKESCIDIKINEKK